MISLKNSIWFQRLQGNIVDEPPKIPVMVIGDDDASERRLESFTQEFRDGISLDGAVGHMLENLPDALRIKTVSSLTRASHTLNPAAIREQICMIPCLLHTYLLWGVVFWARPLPNGFQMGLMSLVPDSIVRIDRPLGDLIAYDPS